MVVVAVMEQVKVVTEEVKVEDTEEVKVADTARKVARVSSLSRIPHPISQAEHIHVATPIGGYGGGDGNGWRGPAQQGGQGGGGW